MNPDLCMKLTEQGCDSDVLLTFVGLSPRVLINYGGHREAHFVTYTDEYPLGVMLTVATLQSQPEIIQLIGGFFVAQGFIGPEVTGQGGERYHVLLGALTEAGDPVPDDVLREIRDRLAPHVLATTPHAAVDRDAAALAHAAERRARREAKRRAVMARRSVHDAA
jgi:hypothetical protein